MIHDFFDDDDDDDDHGHDHDDDGGGGLCDPRAADTNDDDHIVTQYQVQVKHTCMGINWIHLDAIHASLLGPHVFSIFFETLPSVGAGIQGARIKDQIYHTWHLAHLHHVP